MMVVTARARDAAVPCPACRTPASRVHSSWSSKSTAVISHRSASSFGKTWTTPVRRLTSRLIRSGGFVDRVFARCRSGEPAKAVRSSILCFQQHRPDLRELCAAHVGGGVQLCADRVSGRLREDGTDSLGGLLVPIVLVSAIRQTGPHERTAALGRNRGGPSSPYPLGCYRPVDLQRACLGECPSRPLPGIASGKLDQGVYLNLPDIPHGNFGKASTSPSLRRRGSPRCRAVRSPSASSYRHPGQQVQSDLHDLQPDAVLRGAVQGKVPQPGRAGGPDAALARSR